MIRKFATALGFRVVLTAMFSAAILAGARSAPAQQTPAQPSPDQQTPAQVQQPDNQQPGSQEAPEESTSRRRARPHDYKNWTFNLGGGGNLASGTTRTFVRGGGGVVAAGIARNYSKYFGLRADVQFDNLPLRDSALRLAQAPGATDHVYSVMVDPIFNIPATKRWSGYFLAGPSFYHRAGKLDSSTAIPGSACTAFWAWWGACYAGSLRLDGKFLTSRQNEFGENFGGGIARKISQNADVYIEFRYLHGKRGGNSTDLRPITIGVRW